jgi:hypothetical protein
VGKLPNLVPTDPAAGDNRLRLTCTDGPKGVNGYSAGCSDKSHLTARIRTNVHSPRI